MLTYITVIPELKNAFKRLDRNVKKAKIAFKNLDNLELSYRLSKTTEGRHLKKVVNASDELLVILKELE